ncbi:MAG: hypothetical protein OEM38_06295, partial [Gammaproteobacteria bacterium]|nr:hypothetical protein [Gammaproteobacteria bacterium]
MFITSANASSIQPPLVNGTYQFSFENISLGGSEKMGLLGGNYLIDHYSWYSGLGVYGAVTGDRGGFFTGGLHLGKNQPLFRGYFFDANAFVGGGGGGSAPQGGGLMLRTALGLGKQITNNRYFLGLSRVYFPNGAIDSTQLTIAYSRQFTALHFPGWYSGSTLWERWADSALGKNKKYQQVSMEMLTYFPAAGVMGRNFGNYNSVLGMLGVRFSQRLNDVVWGEFETAGAMSGGIDGFAQVLGGISFKQPLTRRFSFNGGWLLGAAGGGNVDTGGGVITRVFTGVEVALFKQWSSYLQFGYATVLDGGFSANTINLNLVYSFNTFSHTQSFIKSSKPSYLNWRKLRIRPGLQKYTLYTHRSRKTAGQQDLDVDLTNLKL